MYQNLLHRICQVQIYLFLQREDGRFPNPLSTYHATLAVFFCQSTTTIHRQFPSSRSSIPTAYWFLLPRILGRYHTSAPNMKDIFFSFVCSNSRSGAFNCLWRNFVYHSQAEREENNLQREVLLHFLLFFFMHNNLGIYQLANLLLKFIPSLVRLAILERIKLLWDNAKHGNSH